MKLSEVKTYEAAVSYCMEIPRFTKKNSMGATKAFYEYLGKPGSSAKIVHVAGTNGKGSVCAFLQSICMEMGKKTAMFTSPHLYDIRERMRINGEWVSKEAFFETFLQLKERMERFCPEEDGWEEYHPSFFEWLFFISMLYFEKEKADIILLETGLGGRLDATNCIDNPAVCVITKIAFDHMEYLGNTIEEIAKEKAGIIKPGIPVVSFQDKKEAAAVIEEKAKSVSSLCILLSNDSVDLHYFPDKYIDFSYKSRYYDYVRLFVKTTAVYQAENAILAATAAEELFGSFLSEKILQKGIAGMHWEGRMEEVLPGVFFDGAHNEDGIDAFIKSVRRDGCMGLRGILFSAVSDKQYAKMAEMITDSGLFDRIYTAPIDSDRGVCAVKLQQLFGKAENVRHFDSPQEALKQMLVDRGTKDYLYAAGSLYLIGQLKEWLKESAND